MLRVVATSCLTLSLAGVFALHASPQPAPAPPTFYRDVLPILQRHCQRCHRPGEIAPMPLVTYGQTKSWARLIRDDVRSKRMPPWFADPCCGRFSDDPSLSDKEVATLTAWADAREAGDPDDAPAPPHWTEGWTFRSRIAPSS